MRTRRGLSTVQHLRGEDEDALRLGLEAGRLGRRNDVETLLTRALAYSHGGLFGSASALFHDVLKIDPVNAEAQYWLVFDTWPFDGDEATEAAEEYFRLLGDNAEMHQFVAFHHHVLGDTELARQHYESAMGLNGSTGSPSVGRPLEAFLFGGMLFEQLGDVDRAEEAWQRGKELAEQMLPSAPGNTRLGLALASLHVVLGDEESAAELENDFLRLPNLDGWGLVILAAAHARHGGTDRAVELLRRANPVELIRSFYPAFSRMADVQLPDTEEFEQLVADIDQERQRLLEQYGPGAAADRR